MTGCLLIDGNSDLFKGLNAKNLSPARSWREHKLSQGPVHYLDVCLYIYLHYLGVHISVCIIYIDDGK